MRNRKLFGTLLAFLLIVAICVPMCFAVSYDKVATEDEMTTVETVGVEGMKAIGPEDVENGTYEVTMESSSSMFKIVKAELTVKDDSMYVDMTLSGKSYPYLYVGTSKKAAILNDVSQYIAPTEDSEGRLVYRLPVKALDYGFACAAFSKNKEKWYDRTLLVRADSLPADAVKVELPDYEALEQAALEKRIQQKKEEDGIVAVEPMKTDLAAGSYSIEVSMTGGSGKASITSPTTLTVVDGRVYAAIQWSSPYYDYMIVEGERIDPSNVEEDSNSSFLIPVMAMDEPFTVIADTTAMGTPHEIEYQLTFDSKTIKRYSSKMWILFILAILFTAAAAFGVYKFWRSDLFGKARTY